MARSSEASVSVYNTGKIVVGGKDSPLRKLLRRMQSSIEGGELLPGQDLPFEIERFPEAIRELAPDVDPVIVVFVEEAIGAFKAGAYLSAAFMFGAASERAVNTLIQVYAESMKTEKNKQKFLARIAVLADVNVSAATRGGRLSGVHQWPVLAVHRGTSRFCCH